MTEVKELTVKGLVGDTAGEVWQRLNQGGPQTLAQLKKKLNGGSELLSFAVGWLAREDKVEILQEKKSILLRLK
ncbi:MAG: winged helix-turn-helix domain-containing protein [Terriglobia bacterium]